MKIYLAGPDVFRNDAKEHGEKLKKLCTKYGFEGLFPLDNEIVPLDSKKIFQANYDLIKECDVVLANIEPFRGPGADAGTAWEMGAAYALGKRVLAYTSKPGAYKSRVFKFQLNAIHVLDNFPIVEDFKLNDNLMLVHSSDAVYESIEAALVFLAEEVDDSDVSD